MTYKYVSNRIPIETHKLNSSVTMYRHLKGSSYVRSPTSNNTFEWLDYNSNSYTSLYTAQVQSFETNVIFDYEPTLKFAYYIEQIGSMQLLGVRWGPSSG